MINKSNYFLATLFLCGVFFLPPKVFSQEFFKFGHLEVHPGIEVQHVFDDNVFWQADRVFANGTSEGKTSDSIFIISPSLEISKERLRGEFFGFNAAYRVNDEKYQKLTAQSNLEQEGRLSLDFSSKSEWVKFSMLSRYFRTQSPSDDEFSATFAGARVKTTNIMALADLEWVIVPRLTANFQSQVSSNKFDLPAFHTQDSEAIEPSFKLVWDVIESVMAIGLKYDYKDIQFTTPSSINRTSESHGVAATHHWQPLSILRMELEVGYETRDFRFSSTADQDLITFSGLVNYDSSKSTRFNLSARRSLSDSAFAGLSAYTISRYSLEWNQRWTGKIRSSAHFAYSNYNFNTISADTVDGGGALKFRNDDNYQIGVNGVYDIKNWLKVEVDYNFSNYDSNFNNIDSTRNTLMISVGVRL